MDELFRHFTVFFFLFVIIRLKFKRYILPSFIILPCIGEVIQIWFPSEWMFVFEWNDMLLNYVSASIGWAIIAAIRENQKIKYNNYKNYMSFIKRSNRCV